MVSFQWSSSFSSTPGFTTGSSVLRENLWFLYKSSGSNHWPATIVQPDHHQLVHLQKCVILKQVSSSHLVKWNNFCELFFNSYIHIFSVYCLSRSEVDTKYLGVYSNRTWRGLIILTHINHWHDPLDHSLAVLGAQSQSNISLVDSVQCLGELLYLPDQARRERVQNHWSGVVTLDRVH